MHNIDFLSVCTALYNEGKTVHLYVANHWEDICIQVASVSLNLYFVKFHQNLVFCYANFCMTMYACMYQAWGVEGESQTAI